MSFQCVQHHDFTLDGCLVAPVKQLAKCRVTRLNKLMVVKSTMPAAAAPRYEDLLTRIGTAQDRDAFIALFTHFAPRVKSYMLKNGASNNEAEEIVQNTFVTVWEKAAQYNPAKAAASTWIFTIARNKRIDALRREKFIEVQGDDAVLHNKPADTPDAYADADTIEDLSTAIDTLPPEQAQLVHMAFFEDKSHQAIAAETHLPLGTVKSRLRLALGKLKSRLARHALDHDEGRRE